MGKSKMVSLVFAVIGSITTSIIVQQKIISLPSVLLLSAFVALGIYHGLQLIYQTCITIPILLKSKYKVFWITRTKYFYLRIFGDSFGDICWLWNDYNHTEQ